MNDIPRTANGWPTVEPNFFTMEQLLEEADNWRSCSGNADTTVGKKNWNKYTGELISRGFIDASDVRTWARRGRPTLIKQDTGWVAEFNL